MPVARASAAASSGSQVWPKKREAGRVRASSTSQGGASAAYARLVVIPPAVGSYHTTASGRLPATNTAARAFSEIAAERARPAVARRRASATPSTRSARDDAASSGFGAPPCDRPTTSGGASGSYSADCSAPSSRRYHVLPTTPWTLGGAPVPIVACPGAVNVLAYGSSPARTYAPSRRSRAKPPRYSGRSRSNAHADS